MRGLRRSWWFVTNKGPDEVFRLLRGGGGVLRGQRGGGDQRDDFMVGHLVVDALGIK